MQGGSVEVSLPRRHGDSLGQARRPRDGHSGASGVAVAADPEGLRTAGARATSARRRYGALTAAILHCLSTGPAKQAEIAAVVPCPSSTLSATLIRLAAKGLILRTRGKGYELSSLGMLLLPALRRVFGQRFGQDGSLPRLHDKADQGRTGRDDEATPEAPAMAAGARRLMDMPDAIARLLAVLDQPRTGAEAADTAGLRPDVASPLLSELCRDGTVIRLVASLYIRRDVLLAWRLSPSDGSEGCTAGEERGRRSRRRPVPCTPPRPQPIRDAIMAFLSEPRQAKEVAEHIGRPVPTATGHLAAMGRRGLVVRLEYGRYGRADRCEAPSDPDCLKRGRVGERILAMLDHERGFDEILDGAGRKAASVRDALQQLRAAGEVTQVALDRFARVGGGVAPEASYDVDGKACLRSTSAVRLAATHDAVMQALFKEHTPRRIAELAGRSGPWVHTVLRSLVKQGRATQLARGVYCRSDGAHELGSVEALVRKLAERPPRQRSARRYNQDTAASSALLAVLIQPRHLAEIAAAVGASEKMTRQRLRPLTGAGAVRRVHPGVYVQAGWQGNPAEVSAAVIARAAGTGRRAMSAAVLACLDEERDLDAIGMQLGLTPKQAARALWHLRRCGLAAKVGIRRFARVGGPIGRETFPRRASARP